MNVKVPTSDGLPPEPPSRVRRLPTWLLPVVAAALMLVAVVVVVGAFSASEDSSSESSDTSQLGPVAGGPAQPMAGWELMYFPGAGTFVDVMDDPDATVALVRTGSDLGRILAPPVLVGPGQAAPAAGSVVWSLDAVDSTWYAVELEAADRAAVSSVAMVGGDVLIAGSVSGASPTPTLWAGPAGGPFRIIDQSFPQSSHLHSIRRLDTDTVLLAHPIEPRSNPFLPFGPRVVLVGEPGNWTDITPPDAEIVNEIISHDGEWIAVGARYGEAMSWHSTDRGSTWSERPPALESGALLTDVAVVGGDAYAAAIIFDIARPHTQLFRYIGSWDPAGEPRRGGISWIADIDGELVGNAWFGQPRPQLWQHATGGRWSAARMALPAASEQSGLALFTAGDGETVVGSVFGQPAMWHSGAGGETVLATPAEADRLWERVATLPADGPFVAFAGDEIIVVASGLQSPTTSSLLVSRDGLEWEEQELPTGLNVTAIREVGGHNVVVGVRAASHVVVGRFDGAFGVMAEFDGALLALDSSEHSIILFIRHATVTTRYEIPVEPDGAITETPVAGRPVAIWPMGDGVVVRGESATFAWPPIGMSVSVDGGIDWAPLGVEPLRIFQVGTEIVVFTVDAPASTFRLEVDPIKLEEISLPPRFAASATAGSPMFEWADGLVIREPDTFEYLAAVDADPVMLELSRSTGFNGVFAFPAAGGHVVAREGEDWVLYRWTGLAR